MMIWEVLFVQVIKSEVKLAERTECLSR